VLRARDRRRPERSLDDGLESRLAVEMASAAVSLLSDLGVDSHGHGGFPSANPRAVTAWKIANETNRPMAGNGESQAIPMPQA
jgi:hypothetical protein